MWSLTWLPDKVKGGLISKQPSSCVQIMFQAPHAIDATTVCSTHWLISTQAKDGLEGEEAARGSKDAVRVQERRAVGLERRVEGCGTALVRAAPLLEDVEHLRRDRAVLARFSREVVIP